MSYSSTTALGNVTRDAEAGQLPDGTATSRFGVAVNTKIKGEEVVDFFNVGFIGKLAEIANQYVTKGREVLVEGPLHLEQFKRNDGTPGTSLSIRGRTLQLTGPNPNKEAASTSQPSGSEEDVAF